jgi:hypothetical protein
MTYALIQAAEPGNRLLCLKESTFWDRRAIPGSEEPEFID